MAVYICEKCLFMFERVGVIRDCPDCGSAKIRGADKKEIAEYMHNRAEFDSEKKEVVTIEK